MINKFVRMGFAHACLAVCLAAPAAAQPTDYPSRAVRIVVGYPPGGTPDQTTRLLAPKLAEKLGQSFVVENRPGASSQLAAELVARSRPDGYTLFLGDTTLAIGAAMNTKLPFDAVADFAPISRLVNGANVLSVSPNLPVKNVAELISMAKAKPGSLNYGTTGNGTASHLCMELFKKQSGTDIVNVPYKGNLVVQGVMAGEVEMTCVSTLLVKPQLTAGRLRALAVTSGKRSSALPDVPTVGETGLPGFEVTTWSGLFAPAKTPPAIIAKLNAAVLEILATQDTRDQLTKLGLDVGGTTPEEFGAYLKSELRKWDTVVRDANIKRE